jgi:hypothetical protein
VIEHELAHLLGYPDTSSGLMSETLMAGTRLATPAGRPVSQVFDDTNGIFVDANELAQLRTLSDDPLATLNKSGTSDWLVVGGASAGVGEDLLSKAQGRAGDLSGNGGDEQEVAPRGKLIGALINWNKSFLGFGSGSRL